MKEVVLDKRVHDQSVPKIRQNRSFPRNQTFAVGDLVYLFAPSAATLQTRSRKFKEDWIGPLQIKAVLDKSTLSTGKESYCPLLEQYTYTD